MGRRYVFTRAQLDYIYRAYQVGESFAMIAKHFGVSDATIQKVYHQEAALRGSRGRGSGNRKRGAL